MLTTFSRIGSYNSYVLQGFTRHVCCVLQDLLLWSLLGKLTCASAQVRPQWNKLHTVHTTTDFTWKSLKNETDRKTPFGSTCHTGTEIHMSSLNRDDDRCYLHLHRIEEVCVWGLGTQPHHSGRHAAALEPAGALAMSCDSPSHPTRWRNLNFHG